MENNKLGLNDWVEKYSTELNEPMYIVKEILTAYVDKCQELLQLGIKISIPNLCVLYDRNTDKNAMNITTAFIGNSISLEHNISPLLVNKILDKYFVDIRTAITNNQPVEIRGLVRLKPQREEDGSISVHINKSNAIKNLTEDFSIRVYTCSWLKHAMSNAG